MKGHEWWKATSLHIQWFTRLVVRKIGQIFVIYRLPHKKKTCWKVKNINEEIYIAPSLEDLVIVTSWNWGIMGQASS